ncbi:MAG TPA: disulfide bond formation protein B [Caulobacteraceae bacterium]|jgi:disulfide bond formation protein DsbB|nr:disulfide bond formation protein B [Caulobacteraceae bacterium]
MAALDRLLKHWPIAAFVISAAALAIAHGFQTFGGLAPCHLCLQQRIVYWVAMGVSAIAVPAVFLGFRAPAYRLDSLILAMVFACGAYLAAFHAGAEWKWWPAPATCSSSGVAVTAADLQALLSGSVKKVPPCDQAPWRLLGLSMAGWNCLLSAALVGLSLTAAARPGAKQREPAR